MMKSYECNSNILLIPIYVYTFNEQMKFLKFFFPFVLWSDYIYLLILEREEEIDRLRNINLLFYLPMHSLFDSGMCPARDGTHNLYQEDALTN